MEGECVCLVHAADGRKTKIDFIEAKRMEKKEKKKKENFPSISQCFLSPFYHKCVFFTMRVRLIK